LKEGPLHSTSSNEDLTLGGKISFTRIKAYLFLRGGGSDGREWVRPTGGKDSSSGPGLHKWERERLKSTKGLADLTAIRGMRREKVSLKEE